MGSIPGSGRFPGEGTSNPLQYSCLGNPIEEPRELQSMGSQRVGHDLPTKQQYSTWHTVLKVHSCCSMCQSFLPFKDWILIPLYEYIGLPRWLSGLKNPPARQEAQETQVQFLSWEDPLEGAWQPTPVSLPGESHGQRSLVGYSPQGGKEWDMTDVIAHTHAWVYYILFIRSFIIHLGCFYFLVIVNDAAMDTDTHTRLSPCFLF